MIYVLAYPVFDPDAAERLQAFREIHEPERAKLVPLHVTLVFGVAHVHHATLLKLANTIAQKTAPFPVSFDRHVVTFDTFEKTHKIFLLCNAGSAALTLMHTQLYDGAHRSEFDPSHPFMPHMTIGTHNARAEIEKVDVSAVGPLPITGRVSALEVVQLQEGVLTQLATIPLAGKA